MKYQHVLMAVVQTDTLVNNTRNFDLGLEPACRSSRMRCSPMQPSHA